MDSSPDFIGTGWRFPITVNAKGGLNWSAGPQRVQDAIWIILSTSLGERVMRPTFGAGVEDFVFEPNSAELRARLAETIQAALTQWEPRIELVDVEAIESPQGPNYVLVTIEYRIRSTNELYNMVYPFFLQEGVG